jgi:hypothetical protein
MLVTPPSAVPVISTGLPPPGTVVFGETALIVGRAPASTVPVSWLRVGEELAEKVVLRQPFVHFCPETRCHAEPVYEYRAAPPLHQFTVTCWNVLPRDTDRSKYAPLGVKPAGAVGARRERGCAGVGRGT